MIIQGEFAKTVFYDDFVPSERAAASVPIPINRGILGAILSRNLASFTVSDYTLEDAFPTPTLVRGMCRSGVCAAIRRRNRTVGFFNIDCPVRLAFRSRISEKAALAFSESLGAVLAVAQALGLAPTMIVVNESTED
jgi:hypothetical protein